MKAPIMMKNQTRPPFKKTRAASPMALKFVIHAYTGINRIKSPISIPSTLFIILEGARGLNSFLGKTIFSIGAYF